MFPPPLLASRPEGLQLPIAVGGPALAGLLCGIVLSVSGPLYTILSVVMIAGGLGAGFEHADALEGAGRGVAGGLLFGTFILFGHALAGGHATASLPSPHAALVFVTAFIGAILGAIGGSLRERRERRETAPTT